MTYDNNTQHLTNNSMSGTTTPKSYVVRKKIPLWAISAFILFYLICPTLKVFPSSIDNTFNRPLYELVDFALVGIWAFVRLFRSRYISADAKKLELAFWIISFSMLLSSFIFVFRGGGVSLKPVYEFIFNLRPLAVFQLVVALCRYYQVSESYIARVNRAFIFVVCISVIYVSLLGLLQYVGYSPAQNFLYTFYRYGNLENDIIFRVGQDYGRVISIFHWANSLGIYLSLALLLIFSISLERGKKVVYFISLGLGLTALILSGSRAAFIVFVFGACLLFLAKRNRVKTLLFIILGIIIITQAVSLIGLQESSLSRFLELVDFASNKTNVPRTFQARLDNFSLSLREFTSDPFLTVVGRSVNYDFQPKLLYGSFDNEYLKFFLIEGAIGLIAFLYFQVRIIAYTWRVYRAKNITTRFLSEVLCVIFISMSVSALSQDVWFHYKILHMVFLFFGLLVYANSNRHSLGKLRRRI